MRQLTTREKFVRAIKKLPNLINYYPLNEVEGTTCRNYAMGTRGSNNGTNTGITTGKAGRLGRCYDASGVGTYITIDRQLFSGNFAFGCLIKNDSTSTNFFFGDTITDIKTGFFGNKYFVRLLSEGSADNTVTASTTGQWIFVVLTRNSDNKVDLYVNGTANRLFSNVAQSGDTAISFIGKSNVGQNYGGDIQHVFVMAEYLTANQATELARLAGVA